jgi:cystathionine beta-lyase
MSASSTLKKAFPQVDAEGHNLPPSPAPSSPHGSRRYNIATELVYTESNDQYNASSVPIYQVPSLAYSAELHLVQLCKS